MFAVKSASHHQELFDQQLLFEREKMHSFTQKSTCFLMTAIAAAIVANPATVLAAGPIVLTNVATPSTPSAPSTAWGKTVLPANAMKGATAVQMSSSDVLHVTVALKLQNMDQLNQFLTDQSAAKTPQWLSSADSTKNYSPTQTQAQGVADYLTKAGFANVKISSSRLFVTADGTAIAAQAAFNTALQKYSINGQVGILNTQAVQVPANLNDIVHAVTGLNTFRGVATYRGSLPSASLSKANLKANVGGAALGNANWPDQFATIYHAGTTLTGAQTDVAIVGWCSMNNAQSDVAKMISDRGLSKIPTSIVEVTTPNCSVLDNADNEGEWAMDAQAIAGISGGVKSLTFYTTNATPIPGTGFYDLDIGPILDRVVTDNKAKIINMSWGSPEDGSNPYDQAFLKGKTQGQLFVSSSGDNGAYPCIIDNPVTPAAICNTGVPNGSQGDPTKPWVNYPTSSPYVISVGGTTLTTTTDTNGNKIYASEAAWSGSGGGFSQYEGAPLWQMGVGNRTKRAVPDVAFDGDPATGMHYFMTQIKYKNSDYDPTKPGDLYVTVSYNKNGDLQLDPATQTYNNPQFLLAYKFNDYTNNGGTSLAAPLFAGAWARLQSNAGGNLVFAPEAIYGIALNGCGLQGQATTSNAIHDVTSGQNGGYPAGKGWDNVTGWGSLDIQNLGNNSILVNRYTTSPFGGLFTGALQSVLDRLKCGPAT